jgi:hypothetical protein
MSYLSGIGRFRLPTEFFTASQRAVSRWHRISRSMTQFPPHPTYRAYKLRATPVSLVPLIIARPSGNTVIS